jgi:hypothetical protein
MANAPKGNNPPGDMLPTKAAAGPGFLGPNYSPGDQLALPGQIGVKRGGGLDDVINAVKGVGYYTDMIAFGAASTSFTGGKGQKPLGVNYFINTGLTCSNGASMWEYVETIPRGDALGQSVKRGLASSGLPPLKGMAPGILEDVKAALNPFPVINAVIGSGYPQCTLRKLPVGDPDGKIQNIDGNLIVDPSGILLEGGRYYQERWIQDREKVQAREFEEPSDTFLRGSEIQLPFDQWEKIPKTHRPDGCIVRENKEKGIAAPKDASGNTINPKSLLEPVFCKPTSKKSPVTLGDGTSVWQYEYFDNYSDKYLTFEPKPTALVSLSVAIVSIMSLLAFWNIQKK